ncbi:N5,N10-methylene tetrahydromethanopterin reductase [Longimycelium tulufanense]|uniref:N5,N10-methylene tetrahydromethanopterin reductase n=1 Tax=Longimycelium tulufanense TaxID=907463 RepID=A0A8J3CFK4_9PSEU|nr:LLM class flavin-dependent oxidoreductase [Longimycelium tulufanense]GGM59159.1 N5,N10-methylene tetrahydromethanopterin reductase [Longimycelium tulufanense]
MSTRRIRLNAFDMSCAGHLSPGLWRHPDDQSHRYADLDYWTELAQLLERGKFDSLFLADVLGVYDVFEDSRDAAVQQAVQVPVQDPLLTVSAMSAVTEHLGFGVTVSLTYEQPYALARKLTTLDHLTKGRVAWNIVTSYLESAARNLGLTNQISHDERYDIADEFLEVCYKLWESSWAEDAVVHDRERGIYVDPTKVRDIDHDGKYFRVPGNFLCAPSPQRTPVLYQAGASKRGQEFAARHAEAIFIMGTRTEVLRPIIDNIRRQVAEQGRDPYDVKIFALATVVTGDTDADARAKLKSYQEHISFEGALALYGGWSGIDFSAYAPDQPLKLLHTDAIQSAVEAFSKADPWREWTPQAIAEWVGIGGLGPVIVGSPTTVADELERWVDEADVDGFNLAYAVTPGTFVDLVELVVPELQRRGRVWTEYEGSTLRETIYGPGVRRLPDNHPGAKYRTE